MIRGLRTLVALAFAALLAGTACAAPPTPMLWKVSKGPRTVWLLGSMHMLRDTDYPLSPDVENAYRGAGKLVFELPPDDMNSPATVALTLKHGMQQESGHTLKDDLSAPLWSQLVAWGTTNAMPAAVLSKFEPWMASLMVTLVESRKIGLDANAGLDMHFIKMAGTDHKATGGLETVDQQLSIFYKQSIKDQDEMLRQSLDQVPDFRKVMDAEHDNWRRGDGDALVSQAKQEFAGHAEMYQNLVVQRNRNWVPQIEAMLADPSRDTLVIVGALHLAGADGVVSLLRQKGYQVERVCTGCAGLR